MEVVVKSVEKVKPSWYKYSSLVSEDDHELRPPFKLCSLDQLVTAATYTPLILFYTMETASSWEWSPEIMSSKLRESLSLTLTSYYPLSGRVKDGVVIENFEAGAPFIESRVQGHSLAEFLRPPKLEFLNKLLPVEPLAFHQTTVTDDDDCDYDDRIPLELQLPAAQVIVQMNTFDCGGIAIGLCFNHQVVDGPIMSIFLRTWAAHCRQLLLMCGSAEGRELTAQSVSTEDLSRGSTAFPPRHQGSPPQVLQPLIEEIEAKDNAIKTATRRFVFYDHAITSLRSLATTSTLIPTRTEALVAFIWGSTIAAATASNSSKPLCLTQAVNLRPRMKKREATDDELLLSQHSLGNLFSMAASFCNSGMISTTTTATTAISALAPLLREAVVAAVDEKHLDVLSSQQGGFDAMVEGLGIGVPTLICSSWIRFGFSDIDFGWGKPVWSGAVGEAHRHNAALRDMIILKELAPQKEGNINDYNNGGIEAWIRIDDKVMAALEKDPDFLQFATPNPPILY
ncbi:unnamed protein product [Linum trigynum]